MARVFLSYARDDRALTHDVHRWLDQAGHEVFFDQDPQDGIAVGEVWRQRLHERLRWADAVVCVVTSASVASSWCTAEIAMAQARGSRLLPLRAEPDADHPLLTDVHHIDLAQDSAAAHAALIAALHRVDAAGGGGWPDDRSPFPGLRPFESDQHRVFFGRADEIKALTDLVRSSAEGTALLVMGPSGCGKSSLVRAGLLPVMADERGWRTLPTILPGADPVTALARELVAAARRIGLGWTVEQVEGRLDGGGLTPLADELLLADLDGPQRRLLVVVDQFEELLTQTPPAQRARFAELLRPGLTGPVRVVGTLRPEFLDQLLADPALVALPTDIFALRPLHREALRLVIEGPARLAGIEVAADLVARLVKDTDSGEALPLLAFTLAQLAEGVSRGGQLSIARYEQLGGVQGALIRQADTALAEALTAGGRSSAEVIAGLLQLVTVDEQGGPTRWRVRRDALPAPVVTELDAFVARRLLSTDTDNGAVVIGVAHEAFLSAWPPLAEAITANVTALRARRAVEHAATEWHAHGRPRTRLWAGDQLAAAVAETGSRVELSTQAHDFLHTGIRYDRRRRRRTRTFLSVLLILALTAAGVAFVWQRTAQEQQRIATASQLVGQAQATRSADLRAALLLGLAAHRLHRTGETHASLVNTLATGPYLGTLTGHRGSVESMALTPDGHTLATASRDTTVILWDLTYPSRPQPLGSPLDGHSKKVNSVAFAPDGRTLATGSDDNTVILWDLIDPVQPRQLGPPLTGHSSPVNAVAFAPDGRTLATGSDDNTVILWDLTDRAQLRQLGPPLTGHTGPVTAMVLTPDGRTLITGSADQTVIRWELADQAQPRQLGSPLALPRAPLPFSPSVTLRFDVVLALAPDGHTLATSDGGFGNALLWDLTDPTQPRQLGSPLSNGVGLIDVVAFAPGGRMLATSGPTGSMLWDLTDPTQPHPLGPPLTGHSSSANSVAFTPDRRTLVVGSDDGTAILWDLTNTVQPQRPGPSLTGHTGGVYSVVFAPDGRTLASGSDDNTVILWDVTNPAQPPPLGSPLTGSSPLASVAFAPDGRTLATGSADGTIILWNLTDPAQPSPLGPSLTGSSPLVSVAFAPDGRTLATGSVDGTIILWDLTDPAQPRPLIPPLTGHAGLVKSMAFAPDGRTLATGSIDSTVILWDVIDRTQPRRLGVPLTGHSDGVASVAFAPPGRTLAIGSFDGTATVWDVTDRPQPRRLGPPLISNTGAVWSVAFSPDGRTLATGSGDTTLWDVTAPDPPRRLGLLLPTNQLSIDGIALSVAFSPDGRTLAVGTGNGTVNLWDLAGLYQVRDHAVQRACSITHGGFDRAEWDRRIPDLPYQDSCPPDGG
ncbi:MAG: nSTAND1 domain-containing NTPase [Pseudonocardiales bacterium]